MTELLKQKELETILNAKEGDIIVPDVGYVWGSPQKEYAEAYASYLDGSSTQNCILMKIKTPIGTRLSRDINIGFEYFEISSLNPYSNMNVVFKRGVSYKVLKKEVVDNKTYITVEYLGNVNNNTES